MRRRLKPWIAVISLVFILMLTGCSLLNTNAPSTDQKPNSQPEVNTIIPNSTLTVRFLDTGQSDCIILEDNGKIMVVDTGGSNQDEATINEALSEYENIDVMVLTHPHNDHIYNAGSLLENKSIGTLYMPSKTNDTKTYSKLIKTIQDKSINWIIPEKGTSFTIGESQVTILSSNIESEEINDNSIVLRVDHGNNNFLLMGDAQEPIETSLLNDNIDVDVLKAGHHGSETSSTKAFLSKVSPQYSVILVGENNDYNLPDDMIVKRLSTYSDAVYQTDLNGTITFTSDGQTLVVTTEK